MRRKPFTHVMVAAILFLQMVYFPLKASSAEEAMTIYFYNPETSVNNFASLKNSFDGYLSVFGNYRFQPFSDRETFEKFIEKKSEGLYLVSSWHFSKLQKRLPITPLLVSVSKGKSTQRNALTSKKPIKNPSELTNKKVASAGAESYTRNIIKKMFGEDKAGVVDSLTVLTVPKDIDALMAVGFGMADLALTSERSLLKLKTINEKQYNNLKRVALSGPALLPLVAAKIGSTDDDQLRDLVLILQQMPKTKEGDRNLKMLGLDGWKKVSDSELDLLE